MCCNEYYGEHGRSFVDDDSSFFHGALRPQKPQGVLGTGDWRWGKREIIYLPLHCHHQNDSCIKMGSDESHINVSLIVRGKVTRHCMSRSQANRTLGEVWRKQSGRFMMRSGRAVFNLLG